VKDWDLEAAAEVVRHSTTQVSATSPFPWRDLKSSPTNWTCGD
jgi:hypothetical protein